MGLWMITRLLHAGRLLLLYKSSRNGVFLTGMLRNRCDMFLNASISHRHRHRGCWVSISVERLSCPRSQQGDGPVKGS